uniref:Uncharacterized protein n=1 Tax=Fagus sylvatica TaxID=28930 RepID=A0A2N9EIE0_FAGSY
MELAQIAQLLNHTLSPDSNAVRTASEALDRLSLRPDFPFSLLSIAAALDHLVLFGAFVELELIAQLEKLD